LFVKAGGRENDGTIIIARAARDAIMANAVRGFLWNLVIA
jgi:hypothetical protein